MFWSCDAAGGAGAVDMAGAAGPDQGVLGSEGGSAGAAVVARALEGGAVLPSAVVRNSGELGGPGLLTNDGSDAHLPSQVVQQAAAEVLAGGGTSAAAGAAGLVQQHQASHHHGIGETHDQHQPAASAQRSNGDVVHPAASVHATVVADGANSEGGTEHSSMHSGQQRSNSGGRVSAGSLHCLWCTTDARAVCHPARPPPPCPFLTVLLLATPPPAPLLIASCATSPGLCRSPLLTLRL